MSDLRRKSLDASAALVAEHGVRQVSFREVARRAGVSHQAPYHHFGNYQEILRHLVSEGFTSLGEAMRTAAEEAGPDPLDALCAAGVAYVATRSFTASPRSCAARLASFQVDSPCRPAPPAKRVAPASVSPDPSVWRPSRSSSAIADSTSTALSTEARSLRMQI